MRKRYETAQTPSPRLRATGVLTREQAGALAARSDHSNPVAPRARLDRELRSLWALAEHPGPLPR